MALKTWFADLMLSTLEAMSGTTTASKKVLVLVEHRRCFSTSRAFVALSRGHEGVDLLETFRFLDV